MQSFKLKLILAFTIMTLFGSLICGSLLYYYFLNYTDDSVRNRLAAAVYSAESALDYSGVEDLLEPGAYKTDYYNEAINKLSRLNANLGTEYLYSIMKDSAGRFVFTLDSGSVDDPVEDDSYLSEVEDWPSLYAAWDSGELVIDQEYYSDEWGTFLSACLPLLNEEGKVFAVIGADISAEELEGAKKSILITFLIALLTAVILSSIFAVVVAFRIVRPINSMADALTDIASGQGDLRRRLDRISNDEIGVMVDNYNGFVETMSEIISRILNSERDLNAGSEELSTGMAQTASALSQIGSNIANVKQQLEIQQDRLEQLSTALSGNGRSINGLNSSIEQQASSLEMSSAAIEEMVSNINSVTDVVNKSENLFDELKQASDHGMKLVETVSGQTRAIAGQSESLIQANSVIAGIASQTNLLAMNAAIEAAHAGEAGKGFSVVADEIRKLAEESAKQSKTIGTSLKKVIDSIDTIVESTDESVKAFTDVTVIVATLLPSSTQIAGAMAEQNTGSGQILESLSSLKNITDEVQKWSTQMMQNGVVLKGLMGELNEISSEVSVSMTEIEKGTAEINSTAGNTAELAQRNMQSMAVLSKQTSRFKI